MNNRTHNIIDTVENNRIYTGLTREEVHEKIGLHQNLVSRYSLNHWHYKKRYYITDGDIKPKVMDFKPETRAVMDRYDKAMEALKKNYASEYLSSIRFRCVG